jgi:4-carboxymuconolactone decarboxylase
VSREERYAAALTSGDVHRISEAAERDLRVLPDYRRILIEALFGGIWQQSALTREQRELVTLSILLARGSLDAFANEIELVLDHGVTPEKCLELLVHDSWYCGMPSTLEALNICSAAFVRRNQKFVVPAVLGDISDQDLRERAQAMLSNYMAPGEQGWKPIETKAEESFRTLANTYYWGATWTRPGLELSDRCLCSLACLAALQCYTPMRSHVRAALNIGLTREHVVETCVQLLFYAGLPLARMAIDVANEVFTSI